MAESLDNDTLVQDPSGPANRSAGAAALTQKVQSLRISSTESSGGASGSGLAWLLVLVLAGTSGYFGWQTYVLKDEAAVTSKNAAELVPKGTKSQNGGSTGSAGGSESSVAGSGGVVHEAKGYVVPAHQVLVSPKVSGMVKWLRIHKPGSDPEQGIPLEEGLRVEQGDILAILETTDYESDVARSRAMLASAEQKLARERKNVPNEIERAQAELDEATTQRDYFKSVLDRYQKLAKNNAISPTELEKAQSDYDSARHRAERLAGALEIIGGTRTERLTMSEADVNQARADLAKNEWRFSNCTIVAPVTGTILKKNVEEGNIVNPVAFNGSFSVCDMAALADLEVDLSIQERDVSRIFKGQRCIVRAEAYPDRQYKGVVSRLMPIADRAKGAIPIRVKIKVPAEEEGIFLKPEMGAVVSFYSADAPVASESQSGEAPTAEKIR